MEALLISDIPTLGYGKYAGVYRVATELRKSYIRTVVMDSFLSFTFEELSDFFEAHVGPETLFVGFSTTFLYSQYKADGRFIARKFDSFAKGDQLHLLGRADEEIHELIKLIRSKNKNVKIVVGGSAVSKRNNLYAKYDIDYFFEKQSDVSIVEFAKALKAQKESSIIYSSIDGPRENRYISQESYPYEDFNTSTIVWSDDDVILPGEALPIEIARGCIFKCKFCDYSLNGKKMSDYTKDMNTLRKELMFNYEKFGTTTYLFSDDLVNDSLDKVKHLHETFQSLPFQIEWSSYARLDLIWRYPEMISLLKEAGAKYLLFGIETLNDKAGIAVGKGLGKTKVLETLQKCSEAWGNSVHMASGFIIGLPHETETSIRETYEWLTSPNCPLAKASFTPFVLESSFVSESDMTKNPEKYGYRKVQRDSAKRLYWENEHFNLYRAIELMFEYNNTPSNRFSFMEAGFYHRFSNLESNINYLGPKNPEIFSFESKKRRQYVDAFIQKFL